MSLDPRQGSGKVAILPCCPMLPHRGPAPPVRVGPDREPESSNEHTRTYSTDRDFAGALFRHGGRPQMMSRSASATCEQRTQVKAVPTGLASRPVMNTSAATPGACEIRQLVLPVECSNINRHHRRVPVWDLTRQAAEKSVPRFGLVLASGSRVDRFSPCTRTHIRSHPGSDTTDPAGHHGRRPRPAGRRGPGPAV